MFSTTKKQSILEPICCILRLGLLQYKDPGTKISIVNNSISFQSPGMFQGIMRQLSGDTREDIHNLYNPFSKIFEWYDNGDEKTKYFYQNCIGGINILLQGYDSNSIIYPTLRHYKQIFEDALEGKEVELEKFKQESPLLEHLKTFWNTKELDIIYQTFLHVDSLQNESPRDDICKNIYLQTIDDIITMKEQNITEYIQKFSTSYH
jgi:hypothetical protein